MRIAPGLHVEDLPGGAVRVVAADWPFAAWFALAALATGAPLVVWAAVGGHWVEFGGGAVFCAFGAVCARLGLAKRRDVEIRAGSVRGSEGAGPLRRSVAFEWRGDARVVVRPFPVPEGAPDLDDRGGDLDLLAETTVFRLARRVGPGWRRELEAVRVRVEEALHAPR